MADYASLAATAKRLIEANGYALTVRRYSAPANPGTPWRPGAASVTTFSIKGVVYPRSASPGGPKIETILVAASGLALVPQLTDHIRVDGEDRGIAEIRPLAPGGVGLLYEIDLTARAALAVLDPSTGSFNLDFSDADNSHHLVTIGL